MRTLTNWLQLCGYLPLALLVAASLLNDRPHWTLQALINYTMEMSARVLAFTQPPMAAMRWL